MKLSRVLWQIEDVDERAKQEAVRNITGTTDNVVRSLTTKDDDNVEHESDEEAVNKIGFILFSACKIRLFVLL